MEKIASIQALRGIAVLMVCGLHFLGPHNPLMPLWMQSIALLGHHGVTMFFVISGFVLPLALSRVDYSLASFPRFALKRLVRLEPPYLVTILIVIAMNMAASRTPGFRGQAQEIDLVQVAAHVGYLAPLVGKPWIVDAFWTLLIEAQFYILIGLTFPVFRAYPLAWIVALALPSAFFTSLHGLPLHLPMFLVGTVAFAWRAQLIPTRTALTLGLLLAGYLAFYRTANHGLFALVAAAYILWATPKSRVLLFIGTISYSLYLVHGPIGVKAMHLAARVSDSGFVGGALGFAAAVAGATILWRLVERPATRLASKIRYSPARSTSHIDQVPQRIQ